MMRLLNPQYEEIPESEIDLEKGRLYVTAIIKPDAVPVDDVTKFAYADDDYEKVRIYERIPDDVLRANRIAELKQRLADTDYAVIKIAEGAAAAGEYADVIADRQAWREEINRLERTAENE